MADDKAEEKTTEEKVAVQWVTHSTDRAHVRTISREDWSGVDVDHDTVTWDRMNPLTEGQAFVSPRAAEYLTKVEPGFKKVPEGKLAFALQEK